MSTPVVTEIKVHLEPVTRDTFIDGLPATSRSPRGGLENRCGVSPYQGLNHSPSAEE
jgi:hypothetical protein